MSNHIPEPIPPASHNKKLRENPRNIPAQIAFWVFVVFLLYMFARALWHRG